MPRGRALKTIALREAVYAAQERIQPASVRACAYQLFNAKLIPAMDDKSVRRVGRTLGDLREEGILPWDWVVDETRPIDQVHAWGDAGDFMDAVRVSFRKDLWSFQSERLIVISEKGTVGGTIRPVTEEYGVAFAVYHGYGSKTSVYDLARLAERSAEDGRLLTILYVGDHDPSGRNMSDVDIPKRLDRYGGAATIERLALTGEHLDAFALAGLTFDVSLKKDDPRHDWFLETHGRVCCELDAMDPNDLRSLLEDAILDHIDWDEWERGLATEETERESIETFITDYKEMLATDREAS